MENSSESARSAPLVGDLAGVGEIINSEVAEQAYADAISPGMKQLGALTEDTLKTFRLFLAPIQLFAAYHDRFAKFCERVREKVPEERQCDAPPEIAKPVMEAFASTSDDSPLMSMFEELMAKAIDKTETQKLSPRFPEIIKSLSPFEAILLADLTTGEQHRDDLIDAATSTILGRVGSNFDESRYGGDKHHLTICQALKERDLVQISSRNEADLASNYPGLVIPPGATLTRSRIRLTNFGQWFIFSCVRK